MVKVRLAEWCPMWKHGDAGDKDFFSISQEMEKETTMDMVALAMGRLVVVEEKKDVKKSKK